MQSEERRSSSLAQLCKLKMSQRVTKTQQQRAQISGALNILKVHRRIRYVQRKERYVHKE